jgi:hypothetical protein
VREVTLPSAPPARYTDPKANTHTAETAMSIVRVGMSEDNKFGEGYDAIFGKKPAKKAAPKATAKKPAKKPATKKPAKKK